MTKKKNPKGAGRKPIDENRKRRRICLSVSAETDEFLSQKEHSGRFLDTLLEKSFPDTIGRIREAMGITEIEIEETPVMENMERTMKTPEDFVSEINSSDGWKMAFHKVIEDNGWIDDTINCDGRICHGPGFSIVFEEGKAVLKRISK